MAPDPYIPDPWFPPVPVVSSEYGTREIQIDIGDCTHCHKPITDYKTMQRVRGQLYCGDHIPEPIENRSIRRAREKAAKKKVKG